MRKITTATQSPLARRYLAAKAAGEDVSPGSYQPGLNSRAAQDRRNAEFDVAVLADGLSFPDEGAATLNEIFPADELEPIESEDEAHAAGVFDND